MEGIRDQVTEADRPANIVCYGDGLSALRMLQLKQARIMEENPHDRMEGIWPCAQEMHKRGLLLQVEEVCCLQHNDLCNIFL